MSESPFVERFREYLSDKSLKYTRQRQAIAEVFHETSGHLSLNELHELARARHSSVGYATVYRTMKLMTESGLAEEHHFGEGQVRYEPAHDGDHHDHLICVTCGRITEFEDAEIERLQDAIASRLGFKVTDHKHEIYGECLKVGCEHLGDNSMGVLDLSKGTPGTT